MQASQRPGFDTVLGVECEMEGVLISSGNIRIDGKFTGRLEITGNILIGEQAEIEADILNAKNISIAGVLKGNLSANKVQILRTGKVWGDISTNALSTEEGAFIQGKVTMILNGDPTIALAELAQSDDSTLEEPPQDIQEDD
jgi:cytoskeletal protein CcmA (bactofilin family)